MNMRLLSADLAATCVSAGSHAANLNHHCDFSAGVVDLAGTINGTPFGGANVAGGTLNLNGSSDWAEFPTSIVPNAGSYSVTLFANGNGVQAGYIELISQGFSGGPGFFIGIDVTGSVMRATDSWVNTGVTFGAPNMWTHYALVVDAGANTSKLYVGGALAALVPYAIVNSASGTPTRLDRQFGGFTEYFNGSIDDVRTCDGLLTPLEVAALAAPVPEPASGVL